MFVWPSRQPEVSYFYCLCRRRIRVASLIVPEVKIRRLIYGVMLDGMGLGQALDGSEEAEVHDADR